MSASAAVMATGIAVLIAPVASSAIRLGASATALTATLTVSSTNAVLKTHSAPTQSTSEEHSTPPPPGSVPHCPTASVACSGDAALGDALAGDVDSTCPTPLDCDDNEICTVEVPTCADGIRTVSEHTYWSRRCKPMLPSTAPS